MLRQLTHSVVLATSDRHFPMIPTNSYKALYMTIENLCNVIYSSLATGSSKTAYSAKLLSFKYRRGKDEVDRRRGVWISI